MGRNLREVAPSVPRVNSDSPVTALTVSRILEKLQERVSIYDARLILDSAIVVSGLRLQDNAYLKKDEAEILCLELINKGGPAFKVGSALYRETLQ